MDKLLIKLLILIFYFYLHVSVASELESGTPLTVSDISDILSETLSVRTSNTGLFSNNMQLLARLEDKNSLTTKQSCMYQYLVGYQLGFIGNYKLAKEKLQQTFDSCDDIAIKIRSLATLANLQVISHQYELAINNLDFAIENIDAISDINLKHSIYSIASLVYRLVNQHELSLDFANLLLNDNPNKIYNCKGLVAKYRIILQTIPSTNIDEAITDTINLCEQHGDYVVSNFLKIEWLDVRLQHAGADKSSIQAILAELKLAEIQINQEKYQNLISIKDSMFAKVYWALGEYDKASEYAQLSLQGSKNIGSTKQKIVSQQILADYYQKIGEADKAIAYLIAKNESEKLHYDDQQAKTMAYQTIKHENLAKSHQIDFLNQKNRVLLLESELSEKSALVQKLTILFLTVLAAFFILWGIRHKKIQKVYKRLSERDHMTLIYNRMGLKNHMKFLLPFSKQTSKSVGYAIFDLDFFKGINDQYGHITGDWVIKNIIKTCQELGNENATFGRLGGEEFAIVLRDSSIDDLYKFCEKCRIKINNLNTAESGHNFKISASFGLTSTRLSGYTYTTLLMHADEALYEAKSAGRNNSVIYRPI